MTVRNKGKTVDPFSGAAALDKSTCSAIGQISTPCGTRKSLISFPMFRVKSFIWDLREGVVGKKDLMLKGGVSQRQTQ